MSLSDLSAKFNQKRADAQNRASAVTGKVRDISNGVAGAKNAVNGAISTAGETFNQVGNLGKTFTGIKDNVTNTFEGVKDSATGKIKGVTGAVNGAIKDAGNLANNAVSGVAGAVNGLKGTANGVANSFGNAFGGSNDIATKSVATSGSGEGGSSPGNRIGGFATDPSITLPSLDPLKREVSKPFEAVGDAASEAMDYLSLDKAGKALSGGWDSLTNIVSSIEDTVAPIQQRIESTMDMFGSISRLPDQIMGQVNDVINSAAQVENQVRGVINGVTHTFKSFRSLAHFSAVDQFISDYASVDREQGLMDVDALRALILSMAQTMIVEGQQEKIEELISRIPDPLVREAIYDDLIVVAAGVGYVGGVEYYQKKLSPGHGVLVADKVVAGLLANLTLEANETYKHIGERILTCFSALKPNWNISTVANRVELWFYTLCNGHALSALLTTPHRPFAVAGGCVKQRTASDLVNHYFPIGG